MDGKTRRTVVILDDVVYNIVLRVGAYAPGGMLVIVQTRKTLYQSVYNPICVCVCVFFTIIFVQSNVLDSSRTVIFHWKSEAQCITRLVNSILPAIFRGSRGREALSFDVIVNLTTGRGNLSFVRLHRFNIRWEIRNYACITPCAYTMVKTGAGGGGGLSG